MNNVGEDKEGCLIGQGEESEKIFGKEIRNELQTRGTVCAKTQR